jgi:asparagine synthase (glutamine-hydrolysing)
LRELLTKSLGQRLSDNGNTWAQLSGGLDSSSIVSLSQSLLERGVTSHGIAGTVTYVDWQDTDADEREYSDAVAARYRVRNEVIVDPPLWTDGESFPPHLDQPRDSLAFYPRERQLCAIVRQSGGRVLLSGVGSDELFTGTTIFFADWVVQGRIREALREMARWAARGRVSFWELTFGNAVLPLIPRVLRHPTSFNEGRLLPWVSETANRRYGLKSRTYSVTGDSGRWGRKYHDSLLGSVRAIASALDAGNIADVLDVRYPFLSRPLIEFALQLPPELCAEPHQRKWVLREAMKGILPEVVRTRIGKGGPTDALVRSLISQHDLLAPLVEAPLLADVGVVDAKRLRTGFETSPQTANTDRELCTDVQNTLMIEAWLRIRSGQWPPGPPQQWYPRSDRNARGAHSRHSHAASSKEVV